MKREISHCPAALGICIVAPIAFILPIWLAVYLLPSGSIENSAESRAKTVAEVIAQFKQYDFDPEASLATDEPRLPPVFLSELPADLGKLGDLDRRKSVFVAIVLPHILWENRRILSERRQLWRLHRAIAAERILRFRDRRWLAKRARRFSIPQSATTARKKGSATAFRCPKSWPRVPRLMVYRIFAD